MNETKRKEAERYADAWRTNYAYLLDYHIFGEEYWSRADKTDEEERWERKIETIWKFCILVDAKNSPLQEYRKKYSEKLTRAAEIVEMSDALLELIRGDKIRFVNDIRAIIAVTTCDLKFAELMRNYRVLHRNNILLFEDIGSLDIDKQISTETGRVKLQELLRSTEDRITQLEDEIFGKSEGSRNSAVRKNFAKELGTVFFHISAERFSKLKAGDRIEPIEQAENIS